MSHQPRGIVRVVRIFSASWGALSAWWGVLVVFAAWQLWVLSTTYNTIVVVSPWSVLQDIASHPAAYLLPLLWTLAFSLAGLLLGMGSGLLLAMLCWSSKLLAGLLQAGALLLIATPVVCLIPLLARMFGYQWRTELLTVALMTFFPAFVYAGSGLRQLPPRTLAFFDTLGASRWTHLTELALPAAFPNLAIALRVNTAYSVLVTVLAEYLMQTGGLGNLFAVTMTQFNLRRALGASLIAMSMSTALYQTAGAVEARIRNRFS